LESAPAGSTNPAMPLIIALVPVLLVLAGVIFVYRMFRNQSR
jgi:cytochrome bd-type quinol oxidase subunit 2